MLRFSWVLAGLLSACPSEPSELLLLGPSRVTDDGREVEVTALVDGKSGVVSIEATAGVFVDDALPLQNGSAVFRYACSRVQDARCAGRVVITARFAGLEATRSIQVVSPGAGAGGGSGVGGGTGDFAGGTAGGSPPFDCVGYDGGVHPGYTFEDGGALSLGCDGEPIDGVFLTTTSANRVSVCGTVRLSQPASMPVYPRSVFIGSLFTSGSLGLNCCSTLRCLRSPNEVRYRFEIESGQFLLGVGARTDDFSYSHFGYYPGTQAAPLPDLDAGTRLVVEGVLDGGSPVVRQVDFFVGPGKRPGDP